MINMKNTQHSAGFLIDLELTSGERRTLAALKLQSAFRGYTARKLFLDLMFENYEKKMNQMEEFTQLQTQENLIHTQKKKLIDD